FSTQHRETLLGLFWMALWPLVQTVALLLAFGGFHSSGLPAWITSYLGVLVWNAAASVIGSNLAIFRANRELITQIVFPFYNLNVVDVTVKYAFLLVQLAIGVGVLSVLAVPDNAAAMVGALAIFLVCYY